MDVVAPPWPPLAAVVEVVPPTVVSPPQANEPRANTPSKVINRMTAIYHIVSNNLPSLAPAAVPVPVTCHMWKGKNARQVVVTTSKTGAEIGYRYQSPVTYLRLRTGGASTPYAAAGQGLLTRGRQSASPSTSKESGSAAGTAKGMATAVAGGVGASSTHGSGGVGVPL